MLFIRMAGIVRRSVGGARINHFTFFVRRPSIRLRFVEQHFSISSGVCMFESIDHFLR